MRLTWGLLALLAIAAHSVAATPATKQKILMSYWSDDPSRLASYPTLGSPALQRQLDAISVLAYGFLQVDGAGHLYFQRPDVDLSQADVQHFCLQQPLSCPTTANASAGSFARFAKLTNNGHSLRRIISIGGADSQRSLNNALGHPDVFTQSAAAIIRAYGLDGIDLDFEPDAFFALHQGEQYAQLVADLRQALGEQAFISIEMPSDSETLHSVDCPADTRCRDNLGRMAANAYVSLMGYEFHAPDDPGGVTGNASNLYSDPDEPLVPHFYHVSDNQAVGYLTGHSVPSSRIILGFPAYFVAYAGVDIDRGNHGLYQPFQKAKTVSYDLARSKGRGTYRVAQSMLRSGFSQRHVRVNGKISATYAYSPAARQWLSYDDPASVRAKAEYVLARNLAGMMMWEIGEDTPIDDPHSLLRSAHAALIAIQAHH